MNDFPDLVPPPERALTPQQRARLRAALPAEDARERHWWVPLGAAAAVVAVVGGGFALSRNLVGGADPAPAPHVLRTPPTNALPFPPNGSLCIVGAPEGDVIYNQVTPVRDVVMTSTALENPRLATLDGAWLTPKPTGSIPIAGVFEDKALPSVPETVRQQYRARRPLQGARLQAGRTYTVFIRVTIPLHGRFDGVRFRYEDGGTAQTILLDGVVQSRSRCSS